MLTSVRIHLYENPVKVKIEDRITGKEVPHAQSIKLIQKDLNIYRCRIRLLVEDDKRMHGPIKVFRFKNNKAILVRNKIECEADVDFTGWPEAQGKKKIFVSIGGRSQALER